MTKAIKYEPAIFPLDFSRGSSGTYFDNLGVLQTAGVDEARLTHEPVSGNPLGLLIEEQRTNLLLWSEAFDDAVWGKTNVTVSPDNILSPDGLLTADKIIPSTDSTAHFSSMDSTVVSSVAHCYGVFAKAGEYGFLQITPSVGLTSSYQNFDLINGVLASGDTPYNPSITPVGDGWYFCAIENATTTTTSLRAIFAPIDSDRGRLEAWSGDGASGIYIWGAQLEQGSFPTSYIKTEGSQVTRSADNCSRTLGSEFNASEGTFFVEGIADIGIDDITYYLQVNVASTEYLRMLIDGTGSRESQLVVLWRNSSQTSISSSNSAVPPGSVFKMAFSFNDSNKELNLSVNGTLYGPVSYAHESPSLSGRNLHIGNDALPNKRFLNRTTKYYPRALSATELSELTS